MYWNEGTYADICLHYMLAETRENLHMVYYQISTIFVCLKSIHWVLSMSSVLHGSCTQKWYGAASQKFFWELLASTY